jgi:hypothetical protein
MARLTAMISSTAVDLPVHRAEVSEACIAADVFPEKMERLPARDQDAIDSSLGMVERSNVYIGIYAWRYGHVPDGSTVSITEMEFDHAQARALTILPFLIDPAHPLTVEMVEADADAQAKLERLKARACVGRGRVLFRSPEQLRGQVEAALKELKIRAQAQELADVQQTMLLLKLALEDARTEIAAKNAQLSALQALLDRQGPGGGGQ